MRQMVFTAALLLGSICQAHAECQLPQHAYIKDGFVKAEDIKRMSLSESVGYVQGFVDGLYSSAILGTTDECLTMARECMPVKISEFRATLLRYIASHPEELKTSGVQVTFEALMQSCIK